MLWVCSLEGRMRDKWRRELEERNKMKWVNAKLSHGKIDSTFLNL